MAKTLVSEKTRHLVVRLGGDEVLPDALLQVLREEAVTCGWVRANGVLEDVELRAYGADVGGPGGEHHIAGPVQALVIEGSIGLADGDVSLGLRAVLARETDRGLEAIAGELAAAKVVGLEAVVTVLSDLAMSRALDPDAGVWLLLEGTAQGATETPPMTSTQPSPAWSEAIAASATSPPRELPRQPPRYHIASPPGAAVLPPRPVKPLPPPSDDGPFPESGDQVEHFAFGTCDVIKSDGERLHVRVHKDGRVKEIALKMLRVTLLTTDGDTRRYRLDRRL